MLVLSKFVCLLTNENDFLRHRHALMNYNNYRIGKEYHIDGKCTWNGCPDASVVHASGSGQLQANPHLAGPWLSPGRPSQGAVTMMGSNDLVVGEDHMLGPSCQRYNWQTGRCGSMAFDSSPRRFKTDLKPPLSFGSIHLWKRLQEITSRKNQEWSP